MGMAKGEMAQRNWCFLWDFYGFYRGLVEFSMKFHGISWKVTEGFISFIGRSSQHLKLV